MFECSNKKIKIKGIKVDELFLKSSPNPKKLIEKTAEYIKTGKIEEIYVDNGKHLIDGYCAYLILKTLSVEKARCVVVKKRSNDK